MMKLPALRPRRRRFGHELGDCLQPATLNYRRFQQGRREEGRKASTRPCLLYSKWGAKVGGGGQISCEQFKMQGGPFNVNIHPASARSRVIAYGSNNCVLYASILRPKLTVKDQASRGFADFQKKNTCSGQNYYYQKVSND